MMNINSSIGQSGRVPSSVSDSVVTTGGRQTATAARMKKIANESLLAIESMRQSSKKILSYAVAADQSFSSACINAVKALWAAMMSVLRFLARLFGVKQKEAGPTSNSSSDLAPLDGNTALTAKTAPEMLKAVEKTADEATAIVKNSSQASPEVANAFLAALEFAGLRDADLALLDMASSGASAMNLKSCDALLANAIERVLSSLENLDAMSLKGNMERAAAASAFSARYEPPILTQDLVNLQRSALAKGLISADDVGSAQRLVDADDALSVVDAHRQTIINSTLLIVASVVSAGISLEPYEKSLQRIAGGNWAGKLSEIMEAFSTSESATKLSLISASIPTKDILALDQVDKDMSANSVSAIEAKRLVAELFSSMPSGNKKDTDFLVKNEQQTRAATAADRLRKIYTDAAKFLPPIDTSHFDENNDNQSNSDRGDDVSTPKN